MDNEQCGCFNQSFDC